MTAISRKWVLLLVCLPTPASANSWMGMAQMSNDMFRQQMLDPAGITRSQGVLQRVFDDRAVERAGKPATPVATSGLPYPAGQPSLVPARLAASLPSTLPPKQAAAAYEQLLTIYRDGMQQTGLPANDVGTALGVFIVGNYQVASGKAVPEALSSATYRQMRTLVANDARLQQLDARAIVPLRPTGRNEPFSFVLEARDARVVLAADPLNRVALTVAPP